MSIRRLGPLDADEYQALRLFALRERPTAFGSSYDEECHRPREHIVIQLDPASEDCAFGAFVHGALVGLVRLGREKGLKERHRGFIRGMYVRPEHRGTGIGKALLNHALVSADAMNGLRQLTLAVTAGNTTAIGLYESAGFTTYGIAPQALCIDGEFYDEIQLVRHRPATPASARSADTVKPAEPHA